MNKDSAILKGQARLEVYKLSKIASLMLRILNFIGINGKLTKAFVRKFGTLSFDTGFGSNLITSAGKAAIAGLIGNTGAITAFSYIAVGTSSTAASTSDTTLGAEIADSGLSRASASVSRVTTTVTNDTLQFDKTFSVTGSKTVAEIGVFNASSSGTLLARKIPTSVSVVNGNALITTYQIIIA